MALLCGVAGAQNSVIYVTAPYPIYESDIQADFTITARQIENAYPTIKVYVGTTDVTSQVAWTWADENRVDLNSDGWLESFSATVQLNLTGVTLIPDCPLWVEASALGSNNATVTDDACNAVIGHSFVGFSPSVVDVTNLPTTIAVSAWSYGVPATGVTRSFTFIKDGVDITPSVVFAQQVGPPINLPSGLVDRWTPISVTVASLGPIQASTDLVVNFSVSIPGTGTFTSSSSLGTQTGSTQLPCLDGELCSFLSAIGMSKAPNGDLSVGTTDKKVLRQAIEDLKAGLRACQSASDKTKKVKVDTTVTCDGVTYPVVLTLGGNASTGQPQKHAFAGDVDEPQKVAIAIGGDSTAPDGEGGIAEATAAEGGVAISLAGTGSGKGLGGRGMANAAKPGSFAASFGGTGGSNQGLGGSGFTSCQNLDGSNDGGQGVSGGGPGGHSGPNSVGGDGGGAGVTSNFGDLVRRDPGPKEGGAGGPGVHGSGACAEADDQGHLSGTVGHSEPNE